MYADKITRSMKLTIDGADYRRAKQLAYNKENNITPTAIIKSFENALTKSKTDSYTLATAADLIKENPDEYLSKPEIEKRIRDTRKAMEKAAKDLDFMMAAQLRDKIKKLQTEIETLT
jgi:excinuclease ABC subunit B